MPDDWGRPSRVVKVGHFSLCVKQVEDGTWSAWIVVGPTTDHTEAQAAIDACLAEAKPAMGMRSHQQLCDAVNEAIGKA